MKKRMFLLASAALGLTLCLLCGGPSAHAQVKDKEEVVYAVLQADGSVSGVYVVNVLPGGEVTDYGPYTSVQVLNAETPITLEDGTVHLSSSAQRVYYQGNLSNAELPWLIEISYLLDGQPITAEELAGASGHMEMHIRIQKNPRDTSTFCDSHALQMNATLDTRRCSNITAEGATQANVGYNRQLTYILLPGTEKEYAITADVVQFEMNALAINGIRMNLDVEISSDDFGDQVAILQNAASTLDDNARTVASSALSLKQQMQSAYQEGAALMDSTQAIDERLSALSSSGNSLTGTADHLLQAMLDTASGTLEAYRAVFDELGIALSPLSRDNCVAELERLGSELMEKGASSDAAQASQAAQALTQLQDTLCSTLSLCDALNAYAKDVTGTAQASAQLRADLAQWVGVYDAKDSEQCTGLGGLVDLSGQLAGHASAVKGSTFLLKLTMSSIDTRITEMANQMIASRTGKGVPILSFADARNGEIAGVQFVITTPSIRMAEAAVQEEQPQPPQSFWDRLLKLFR